jgi:hypothetical protein
MAGKRCKKIVSGKDGRVIHHKEHGGRQRREGTEDWIAPGTCGVCCGDWLA